ncbi:rRNA methyltransferase 2, mitochondrial isoform X2 [Callorhinchus milii]|nr:rRNA methyltransferase 2, mitochondrial isoform X2 [Callorhinchus milii]XP_007903947.1 rRNA methyltransferase 2, mitochondrial isoform X2 [Callorhinchus milii]XP_042197208.1 rRNA methyltransferase 2, mitochondrial isoform X2 [Callorhinchus milii]|eukprot:gi/632974928/ref/XP_007903945.1/ PREDICTED: putative ribosomal RNA methyltransferase 2 isoform X2 [Callorhinchus milii]
MISRASCRLFHSTVTCLRKTPAEKRWVARQLRDPFVKAAQRENYRCRSAFKLLEINEKHKFLRPGVKVVDCGAAPGAWSQVAVHQVNATGANPEAPVGFVVGVDLLHISPLPGAAFLSRSDILEPDVQARIQRLLLGGEAHVIVSDMAPNASGIRELDQERLVELCRGVLCLAEKVLCAGGTLLCKFWDGAESNLLRNRLTEAFRDVKTVKPLASRKESSEIYLLAKHYYKH